MRNKSKSGFTLVEIIVVLVILAILAAIAIPSYLGFVDKTKEAECKHNIGLLNRVATAALLNDSELADKVKADSSYFLKYVNDNNLAEGLSCPSGGTYRAYYNDSTKTITVVCSKHATAVSGKYVFDISTEINSSKFYMGGTELQEKLASAYGGSFPTVDINGVTYYLKADRQISTTEATVYASKSNSSGTKWVVDYIYDDANDKWYKYVGTGTYMTASKSKSQIMSSLTDTTLWAETNDIY